jgi:uncharacterized protein YndB with AHSA1/START domain
LPLKFGILEQTVFFPDAAPAEVYGALLDAKKHAEFTGSPATTSAKKGAEFIAWGGYISGRNLELVRGRKIVQEWKTTEWPEEYPSSRLEFTLAPKRGGTELVMIHSKVPAEQLAEYSSGWKSSYWEPLKRYLALKHAAPKKRAVERKRAQRRLTRQPRPRRGSPGPRSSPSTSRSSGRSTSYPRR